MDFGLETLSLNVSQLWGASDELGHSTFEGTYFLAEGRSKPSSASCPVIGSSHRIARKLHVP
jgi:hypothetical protein